MDGDRKDQGGVTLRRFDEREPARAAMLDLARSLGWPRVEWMMKRERYQRDSRKDWVGPGVTPWYALAEQVPADVVKEVTERLRNGGVSR